MPNITATIINGKSRYRVELSPGTSVEASTLAEILRFVFEYGGNNAES